MVECTISLDDVFRALADATRRDILRRGAEEELCVGELAKPYKLTFAAISKHLKVLENAKLIVKRRQGRQSFVKLSPTAFAQADGYLRHYEKLWNDRFDSLERYLAKS